VFKIHISLVPKLIISFIFYLSTTTFRLFQNGAIIIRGIVPLQGRKSINHNKTYSRGQKKVGQVLLRNLAEIELSKRGLL
jgi:hypothetical protein